MRTIHCTIEGTAALLMHRFPIQDPDNPDEPVRAGADRGTPRQQAMVSLYAHPAADGQEHGTLYQPAEHIRQSLVAAATSYHKVGRKSAGTFAAAGLFIKPDIIDHEIQDWVVDSRPVVIKATQGRILRHRPRLETWRLSFDIEYDEAIMEPRLVRAIVDDAGSKVGIGDYRPQKKGPYGRFMIIRWEEEKPGARR